VGDIDIRDRNLISLYPNPFLHSLNLSFSITARDVPLEVSVYDVRGKLVRRVLSADSPGLATVTWDGTDSFGRKVASGTYLVAVRSPGGLATRTVVLLR
jgi:flagellar hook assembly protein FlgD